MKRLMSSLAAIGFAAMLAAPASATSIGFEASFFERGTLNNPRNDLFTITNTADAGVTITSITIDLGTANSPFSPVFDTVDGCSPEYCYGEMTGSPVTEDDDGSAVGFVAYTEADQAAAEEASSITLNFTDFDAGETFGLLTDVDTTDNFFISGIDFSMVSISVTFAGAGLAMPITLPASFMADATDNFAAHAMASDNVVIPLPAGLWLLLGGLGALATRRR